MEHGLKGGKDLNAEDRSNVNLEHNSTCEYVVEGSGDLGVSTADVHEINLLDPMLLNDDLGSDRRVLHVRQPEASIPEHVKYG